MTQPRAVELLIENADIFTGDRANPHIKPGAIAVDSGIIVAIGSENDVLPAHDAAKTIDARGGIVHPGFIETHLHLANVGFHGLPIDIQGRGGPLPNYSQLKCESDDEITAAITQAAAVAFLRRGFTMIWESGSCFETDAFAESLTAVGMRGLVTSPYAWDDITLYEQHGAGYINDKVLERAPVDMQRVIDECEKEIKRNKDTSALVKGYAGVYGEASSTDELISAVHDLAIENGVVYYQHQSFHPKWTRLETEYFGERGLSRLDRLGVLRPGTALAHMNCLTRDDIELVVEGRPGVIWCPHNSMNKGSETIRTYGVPHPELYQRGVVVSLGIDAVFEITLGSSGIAALLASRFGDNEIKESDPFYMQTIDAAKLSGFGDSLGSLEVGKKADIVVREFSDITYATLDDWGKVISYNSAAMPVDAVIIDGRVVLEDGRVTTVDQDEVLARGLEQRDRLFERANL